MIEKVLIANLTAYNKALHGIRFAGNATTMRFVIRTACDVFDKYPLTADCEADRLEDGVASIRALLGRPDEELMSAGRSLLEE